ncbi:retrovirus-related Pol polyprotein from transposon TNT 1-94 [Trifolium medium]|uniref:Retrovirus-related Pol polyprotein from transposon TNT 1-94 n=1 Tax=Trifolium medium TaxID=97028 RepID=A0A392M3T5_9FABA|nr:retrovirus-related Pol polyprotein from transposon TNT 1-94 [Trifolium medium]
MALATSELLWVQSLLTELSVPFSSPTVFCDNLSTIALAHNPVLHARTKHMELDLFFVREKVMQRQLAVLHVPSHLQYADIMTKALPPTQFENLRTKLTLSDSSPS